MPPSINRANPLSLLFPPTEKEEKKTDNPKERNIMPPDSNNIAAAVVFGGGYGLRYSNGCLVRIGISKRASLLTKYHDIKILYDNFKYILITYLSLLSSNRLVFSELRTRK